MEKLYIATEQNLLELVREAVRLELQSFAPTQKNNDRAPSGTRIEISKHLQISLSKLDTMTKTGELKSFKLGRQVRYKWVDIEDYLQSKG